MKRATAGGHNAPPRGKLQLTGRGEPVAGERDAIDLGKNSGNGRAFLAGGRLRGSAAKLREALELGAAGVQVGRRRLHAANRGCARI